MTHALVFFAHWAVEKVWEWNSLEVPGPQIYFLA